MNTQNQMNTTFTSQRSKKSERGQLPAVKKLSESPTSSREVGSPITRFTGKAEEIKAQKKALRNLQKRRL